MISQANSVRAAAAVFLCTGLSIAALKLMGGLEANPDGDWIADMAIVSPLIFLCAAAALVFSSRPNLGHILGGIAAVVALPWFVLTESSVTPSVWSHFNGPEQSVEVHRVVSFLKILSVALITATVTCSILGTLRRQMWPAGPVAILVLSAWFYHSASPWFIPVAVDRWPIDLTILHVEKRGLQFHETAVSLRTYRANRFQVDHNDRRLFQYSFMSQGTRGVLPDILLESANELAHSTKIVNLRTAPPVSLRSWNAEGWYVSVTGTPLLAFTSEYSTNPPQEIKEIFEQIQKLPGSAPFSFLTQDVCLGFCYDPTAGLGLRYANNRCHQVAGEPFECH